MKCPDCGAENPDGKNYCSDCGSPITLPQPLHQPRLSKTALTFAIVLSVVLIVVLGVVVYYLSTRFDGGEVTPVVAVSKTPVAGGWQINILSIIQYGVPWDDIKIHLEDGSNSVEWSPKSSDLDGGNNITASYSSKSLGVLSVFVMVTDRGGNGIISAGDYFTLLSNPPFSPIKTYSVTPIYKGTGQGMCMEIAFTGTAQVTPAATYSKSSLTNGEQINIVSITRTDVPWDEIQIWLSDGTNIAGWDPMTADLDGGSAVTVNYTTNVTGPLTVCLHVTDVGGNGFVSASDYFKVFTYQGATRFSTSTIYSAVLIFKPTGESIGSGVTFTGV